MQAAPGSGVFGPWRNSLMNTSSRGASAPVSSIWVPQALATTGPFAVAPSAETARAWAHDDAYYRALLAASRSRGAARADAFGGR